MNLDLSKVKYVKQGYTQDVVDLLKNVKIIFNFNLVEGL
jgi:hypothetical protein